MKTFFRILICVAALATMSAVVSCNKDNGEKASDVTFKAPEKKSAAKKFIFENKSEGETISYDDGTVSGDVVSIDNTAEGRSIILIKENVKADDDIVTVISTFTYTDGKWTIKGVGTISEKEGGKVEFTAEGATTPVEVPATVAEPMTGATANNLCRLWKIESTTFVAKGGELGSNGVGTTFTGAQASSAKAIAEYLAQKGNIEFTEDLTGYDIKTIEVTDAGSLIIEFTGKPSFAADITLKGTDFDYNIVAGDGNEVINAEAKGKVEFAGTADSPRCRFTVIGKIVNGKTTYTTNIEFVLVKA